MRLKDFFYFEKSDRLAIILLIALILLATGIYFLLKTNKPDPAIVEVDGDKIYIDSIASTNNDTKAVDTQANKTYPNYPYQRKIDAGQTIELNSADTTQLKTIPGIGSAFSNRIVKYRNLLGGYYSITQLREVWGIDEELYKKITPYITIKPKITTIHINSADFNQLNKHPYISYEQTKTILDICQRKGPIESIDRLSLLEEFSEADIKRLKNYISFD